MLIKKQWVLIECYGPKTNNWSVVSKAKESLVFHLLLALYVSPISHRLFPLRFLCVSNALVIIAIRCYVPKRNYVIQYNSIAVIFEP